MAERKATSLDVAALAGVSQSAVSRVFTPGASVSEKMAARVLKAARELDYHPNVLARSLITGRTRIIGLVVAYLENQFYPDALERLSNALQCEGYHILVFLTSGTGTVAGAGDATGEGMERVIGNLMDYQVDGIIAASVGMSDQLAARCSAAGIPVVLFNRGQADARLSQVTSDNSNGAERIAEILAAGGHRRIAHVSGLQESSTGRERKEGFLAGLAKAGLEPVAVVDGHYDREVAAAATRALWAEHRPDAIFAGNDHMAFAVVDVLRHELGLSVPGDVSVVGYDDVPMAGWAAYDLTTMRQPSGQMVTQTVKLLMERISRPDLPPRKETVSGELILRGSARVPEGWR